MHNMNMLYLPILHNCDIDLQLDGIPPHEYYWVVLEATKEVLINELFVAGKLDGTSAKSLMIMARKRCLPRAKDILAHHLSKCNNLL